MTTIRITQVAVRAEPHNNFVLLPSQSLQFTIDSKGRQIYRIQEYQIGLVEEGVISPIRHYQLGTRGDYIIQDITGNLSVWTEEQYKKL